MRTYKIIRYNKEYEAKWNLFVDNSANGTFLFRREYMEYHAKRFTDASLIILDDRDKICALFVASVNNKVITAHGGLTYGGLVLPFNGTNAEIVLTFLNLIISYAKSCGVKEIIYKAVPHIYHKYPCEDDIYALFRCGATLQEVNVSSTIDLSAHLPFDENARRGLRKGIATNLRVIRSEDYEAYWDILTKVLDARHGAAPVHTLPEIMLLKSRFPKKIELYIVRNYRDECVAGVVIYLANNVAHCQYIASSEYGFEHGALAYLFDNLIDVYSSRGYKYLDFGTCNEQHGQFLNVGLVRQKNGFGGRAIVYSTYSILL